MIDAPIILRFLEKHFDKIKSLYITNKDKGSMSYSDLAVLFETADTIKKLEEYQIIEEKIDSTYVLRDLYYRFIEGLLDDYSLDMPAQISKYYGSLSRMYVDLEGASAKNDVIKQLNGLNDEIKAFEGQLKRNIGRLISETKKIKANNEKLTYKQKLQKASDLTTTYVDPLNIILSNHEDSIFSIIEKVLNKSNNQRFINDDQDLCHLFFRVYESFSLVKNELLNENRLLVNEVFPLLQRIRTESQMLTGFINYLANRERYDVPQIMETKLSITSYNSDAYYDARDVWDGYYETVEDVVMSEAEELEDVWIYDQEKYMQRLYASLPNNDYYKWVHNTLQEEIGVVESKAYLQLSKLIIMANDIEAVYTKERCDIMLEDKIFNVPIVQIKGVSNAKQP